MENKNLTAIEWLIEQTYKKEWYTIEKKFIIEQAKQMEEEEKKKVIVKSWQDGFDTGNYISTTTGRWNGNGEDYYNETYGNNQNK